MKPGPGSAEPQLGAKTPHAKLGLGAPSPQPGYKQTEVGVIPEEWDVFSINQIFQFKQGVQSPVEQQAHSEREGYKRFIRIIDITDPSVPWRYIEDPGKAHHVGPNDLFMVRYGSPGLLGFGHEGVIANNLFRLIPKKRIGVDFYFHYLNSRRADIADISGSSTMPAVNFSTLGGLQLIYPPSPEQRGIAAVLSDVDGLLGALDRLIAKKRDLKQAAMQQLLTGQTRLPGFKGVWVMKTFGDVAVPRRDRIDPRRTGVHNFCIELEHIASASGELLGSTITGAQSSLKSVFGPGDVLFGKLRAYLRKYWLANKPGVCSTEIWVFTPKDSSIATDYLFQLIKTDDFIEAASNSYGTHMPRSDWNVVKHHEVTLPPLPEQTAIATILSEMDAELAGLEQRREKTRALKQGMMQELLTGRTRLL